jgi:NDP-sugar pyrophosphorylase family protein
MPNLPTLALLAGGLATRLGPLTKDTPKSLLIVDGEPFLAHQLRLLRERGICDIVICCGHFGEKIERFAGDGSRFGCSLRYSYDGEKLLGTGGALHRALPLLGESFFVMYGDSYLLTDPEAIWQSFLVCGAPALMSIFRNEDRWDRSNVQMSDGRIVRYGKQQRTPAMQYIDYGWNALHSDVLRNKPDGEAFDLACVFEQLAIEGRLAAHEVPERFYEIGSYDGLQKVEALLRSAAVAGRSA